MSLEAIQEITRVEKEAQEGRAAAEAEAREIVAAAEREGQALLVRAREEAVEDGKQRMRGAEERAAVRAEEIRRQAEQEGGALRQAAEAHLEEAADLIIGRVVKH